MPYYAGTYGSIRKGPPAEVPAQQRPTGQPDGYDIIVFAGQSNLYLGQPEAGETLPDPSIDTIPSYIKQWSNSATIVDGSHPYQHFPAILSGYIGVETAFCKLYDNYLYRALNRPILAVPVAYGGTGFSDNNWNKGDSKYNNAVTKSLAALASDADNEIVAIVWMQGEKETATTAAADNHATAFPQFVDDFRTDLGDTTIPFVAGGMVPAWTATRVGGPQVQAQIESTMNSKSYAEFASSVSPTSLTASSITNESNEVHYSAQSLRGINPDFTDYTTCGMAGRLFNAWRSARTNS